MIKIKNLEYYDFIERVATYYLFHLEEFPEEKITLNDAFNIVLMQTMNEIHEGK